MMAVESPKVMLLVEDDALLRECLTEVLGDEGWLVIAVTSAAAALDHIKLGGRPDVLMTDLWLGAGMNGLTLIAEARCRWPGLHALLASGADVDRLDMHHIGHFLAKPFSMDALIQVVTELTRKPVAASCCVAGQP